MFINIFKRLQNKLVNLLIIHEMYQFGYFAIASIFYKSIDARIIAVYINGRKILFVKNHIVSHCITKYFNSVSKQINQRINII